VIDPSDTSDDLVVLVDEHDDVVGVAPKIDVHREGRLHRAVSVMLFDEDDRVLLQRRASEKYHSPGLWSNTCCGHPRPEESALTAARRRLNVEMGIENCELVSSTRFLYRERVSSSLVEHEVDHLFVGVWNGNPTPNPTEVSDWRWLDVSSLRRDVCENAARYTAWLSHVMAHLPVRLATG
jgi:isopentenyl-diphosphate delta-isomerase